MSAENLKEKSLHARVKGQEDRSLLDDWTLKAVHRFDLIVTSLALQCVTSFVHIFVLIVNKSFQISHSRDGPKVTVCRCHWLSACFHACVPYGQQTHGWEIWESFSSGMKRLIMTEEQARY